MNNQDQNMFRALGSMAAINKEQFVDMLHAYDIDCSKDQDISQLIDLFIKNAPIKKELTVSGAYFAVYTGAQSGFDGKNTVDNELVHNVGRRMYSYFNEPHSNINWQNVKEGVQSTGRGFREGGWAGGLGAAMETAGGQINRRASDRQPNVGTDVLRRQQAARNQMVQGAIAVEEARLKAISDQAKAKSKTTTIVVISLSVLVVAGIGAYIYFKNRKNG